MLFISSADCRYSDRKFAPGLRCYRSELLLMEGNCFPLIANWYYLYSGVQTPASGLGLISVR